MASNADDISDNSGAPNAGSGSAGPGQGGASAGADGGSTVERLRTHAAELRSQAASKAAELREQATDQVFAFASQGKDRATEALDGAAKLINDAAAQIEDRLGGAYGGYARQAGDTVSSLATSLRSKEVDQLVEEARGFIKKSPALALGAAAAAGFLVARLVKAGSTTIETAAKAADSASRERGEG